jgi:hypothetical protein
LLEFAHEADPKAELQFYTFKEAIQKGGAISVIGRADG